MAKEILILYFDFDWIKILKRLLVVACLWGVVIFVTLMLARTSALVRDLKDVKAQLVKMQTPAPKPKAKRRAQSSFLSTPSAGTLYMDQSGQIFSTSPQ